MTKKQAYLCDISHISSVGLASGFIPYGVGWIESYSLAHGHSKDETEIGLLKDALLLRAAFLTGSPQVVAFSNYVWNSDLSLSWAGEMKKLCPEVLVVFEGPDYPLENVGRRRWLSQNPWLKSCTIG